jgi:outer membrane protein assembly factor BamA
LAERFYSGGPSSHRGFPDNQAGPRDTRTGFPVGGSAMLLNNVELRFPLLGDNLGGVVFHDAGNVYSSLDSVSLRATQRDNRDFDYMVHAVGLGFRYRTPIGPVRLDFAWAGNAPRFVGFRGSRQELIAGTGQIVAQRLNRFQFHFSLGQTF